ncbi:MAG: SDR family NAD(P)-dependent oxidoreductase, partial [Deltaproteobacteria bacterium]|nr:SDR family NAD(P)-dependent oxidoreductase [Deltaproteobacteria bacterium]
MSGRLQERVAIVTGGSSGIGQGACLGLAAEGASVVVVGRTPAHIEETIRQIDALPGRAPEQRMGLTLDVTNETDMEEMARRTVDRFGRIDILVASAGVSLGTSKTRGGRTSVAQMSMETWDEIMNANLKGMFLADRAVLGTMIR